jgi:hypothetical protein
MKAAGALLHIASLSEPPLRLLLGTDAYNAAEKHPMQMLVVRPRLERSQHLDRLQIRFKGKR